MSTPKTLGRLTAHTSYDALRYYNPRPLKPWLLELTTDDGEEYHGSEHDTADEARARRREVLNEWHARGLGQDPASQFVSPKAIHSCISERGGAS